MEELNHSEEAIMRILWEIERGVLRDILDRMPSPQPPYTTVSSVVRLLEKKGYVGHKAYGKTYEYYPLVTKATYRKKSFNTLLRNYFEGSAERIVSFMVQEKGLKPHEIEEIKKLIDQHDQEKRS